MLMVVIKANKIKTVCSSTDSVGASNPTGAVPSTSTADPVVNVPCSLCHLMVGDRSSPEMFQNILTMDMFIFFIVESITSAAIINDSSDSDDELYSTCDTVTAKPLKKGRNLLKSGFVVDIHDNFNDLKQEYYIRCHVHHSMKNELPLNVNIVVSNVSGYIKCAQCDCRASAIGRCCHVAALLLKLSDFSKEHNVIIQPSTSEPCTWNKGKK